MTVPFHGQGGFPEEPVDIYVSPMMERLLEVDDKNYRFENVVYLYLSWRDTKAFQKMKDSTDAYRNSTRDCSRPCSSEGSLPRNTGIPPPPFQYSAEVSCCDDVWLPTIGMQNVYELPEGRVQPYSILVEKEAVAWWTAIHAIYFTPMDFRLFPFDSQKLQMQFHYQSVDVVKRFIPSTFSSRFLIRGEGDIVSGWAVANIEVITRNFTLGEELDFFISKYGGYASPDDPFPLKEKNGANGSELYQYYDFDLVTFDIVITINRLWRYYVLNMIVPIILLVCLSLITYVIPGENIDARIALNLTLFLSLTALQFIINDQLPKSSYPSAVTKLVLICYICVAFGVPETIVVYAISRSSKVKEEMASKHSSQKAINEDKDNNGVLESNMSLVMKVMKRKKSAMVPFIIDMVSLVVVFLTVIISTVLVLHGY